MKIRFATECMAQGSAERLAVSTAKEGAVELGAQVLEIF